MKLPPYSSKLDYEAEVAFVIGKRAKEVPEADGLDYVAGYMLLNDLSARDMQFKTPQWMPGKVFDGAAPCGPWLVTPDEAHSKSVDKGGFEGLWSGLTGKRRLFPLETLILLPQTLAQFVREEGN